MYLYSVICILELGSNLLDYNEYERWPPFCLPGINHPQDPTTMQAKLGRSHTCGVDAHKTFFVVLTTN